MHVFFFKVKTGLDLLQKVDFRNMVAWFSKLGASKRFNYTNRNWRWDILISSNLTTEELSQCILMVSWSCVLPHMLALLPLQSWTTPVSQDDGAHTCSQHCEKTAKSHMEGKQHSQTGCYPTSWQCLAHGWAEQENGLPSHSGSRLSDYQ
jgi:hypothetical protein